MGNTQPSGLAEYISGEPAHVAPEIKREDRELVKLTVKEAAAADADSFSTKLVEISGDIEKLAFERQMNAKSLDLVAVLKMPKDAGDSSLDLSYVTCVLPDDMWKKVSAGSNATFRGILTHGMLSKRLHKCELVSTDGDGAIETTVAEMLSTADKSFSEATAKYDEQSLVVRGEFVKLLQEEEVHISYYYVGMYLKGDGEQLFAVHFDPAEKDLFTQLKPGDKVRLLGVGCLDKSPDPGDARVGLTFAHLLREAE